MELSLRLSFLPQGLHSGQHRGIPSRDCGGFNPTISPLNPAEVPTVTYEYLFCPPSSDQLRPPAQWRARGLLSGSSTPGTVGCQLQPKILDTVDSLQWQMAGEPYTPYQIKPTTLDWRGGATNIKRTNPGSNPRLGFFHPAMGTGRQDFTTCLTLPSPSSTQVRPGPLAKHAWGLSATDKLYRPRGFGKQWPRCLIWQDVATGAHAHLIACTRVPNLSHYCLT
jgi:hypothetical protein